MKWILLVVTLVVIAPGSCYLLGMDYEIPISNSLLIVYAPVVGGREHLSLCRHTGGSTFTQVLSGVSHYGESRNVTYGDAEDVRSCLPRGCLSVHARPGYASVEDEGPYTCVGMPKAWFIMFDGIELHLYSHREDWQTALGMHGINVAGMRTASRLYSPIVWYASGVLLAVAGLLAMSSCGALWAIRRCRQRSRQGLGRCIRCGYNLTGNTSGRCPECGEPVLAADPGEP